MIPRVRTDLPGAPNPKTDPLNPSLPYLKQGAGPSSCLDVGSSLGDLGVPLSAA